jgi:hypothetical protein
VALTDLGHLVAEAGPGEVGGVGVDHRVGEQVPSGLVEGLLAVAHPGVHVGVDLGVPPARTCSTDHATWEAGR